MSNNKIDVVFSVVISVVMVIMFTIIPSSHGHGHTHIRNNDVKFICKSSGKFDSITFTEDDYSITSGQPYKGISNKNSMSLRVRAGRKKSSSPASHFNSWVGKNNNYGRNPGELNFVVKGTLTLKNKGQTVATFQNIALAQGNSGSFNDWWIGGADCGHPPNKPLKSEFNDLNCYSNSQLWCFKRSPDTDNEFLVWKGHCDNKD